MTVDAQRFQGGGGWITRAGVLGVLGLGVTGAGIAQSPREALYSYLVAFGYWGGIAFGALILLMIFHAFRAKWMVVVRRPVEAMAATLPLFALLFIPIALGLKHVYSWANPGAYNFNHEQVELLHHKAPYLNAGFFIARAAVYFLLAIFISQRLFKLSTRQDDSGDVELTVKQRTLGTGGIPFIAVAFSFASFDWLMSLDPFWFSTIFGVYWFAGSFHSAIALLIILIAMTRGSRDLFGEYATPEHTHNLGKLLFAFTCFWGYIAFSQMMLIWIAGLPEEIGFFKVRFAGSWAAIGVFLAVGKFGVPFLILLSKNLKRQPKLLALPALWIMFTQVVDIYWLVMPNLAPEGATFHWTLPAAFVGVGGLAIAFGIWRLRGHFAVPVKDPFLPVSLRYRQP